LAELARHAGRPALRLGSEAVDYAGLAGRARAAGAALDRLGLEAGDLLAVRARPSIAGVALLHAALARRIVLLPLNARLAESEQQQALEASGARGLIVDGDVGAASESLAKAAGCGLAGLSEVGGPPPDPGGAVVSAGLEERIACPRDSEGHWLRLRTRRRAEGAALVLRTSGTSGVPKGAVIGFEALMASADAQATLLGSDPDDRWLLCMPLFHIGGLSIPLRAARVGAEVHLHVRFDAGAVARSLETDRITRVSFVATMLQRVLEERGEEPAPPDLVLVLLGGGPASEALLEQAERLGYPIAPTYGLTECASQAATRPPGRRVGAGQDRSGGLEPLPGVRIRIVDAAGNTCAPGREGEIELRGPILMQGYLDDPEATGAAFREGWLRTGDQGRLDEEGRLRVLDRRSDLILSGGENVYPAEVESVLAAHPAVLEAGVAGRADAEFGARPEAWVVMRAGAEADPVQLDLWCRGRMAGYKCPRAYHVVEALPRTPTGKLRRAALGADPGERVDAGRG
jgi:O-succinylbenzoic acid--CoA ligase